MMGNREIAGRLAEVASLLEMQGANPYRVSAYRRAAATVRDLRRPVGEMLEELTELPGIGERLAAAIREMATTGRYPLLEHLRGEVDAVQVLQSAPGIGRVQAERLHRELGIDSLEDLEAAAHDGRLELVMGFGSKRVATIMDALATRLGRGRREGGEAPPVAELLDVDREYREAAAAGRLPKIAPRRFNPGKEAWLPILHTERGTRHYTVLFSNTARAHEMGKTGDWVVIYEDGGTGGSQHTVITDHHAGPLAGKRVVRGREAECRAYHLDIRDRVSA